MGVSGKWIKALVGLKKSEKPEKDGNVSLSLITLHTHIPEFQYLFSCYVGKNNHHLWRF